MLVILVLLPGQESQAEPISEMSSILFRLGVRYDERVFSTSRYRLVYPNMLVSVEERLEIGS